MRKGPLQGSKQLHNTRITNENQNSIGRNKGTREGSNEGHNTESENENSNDGSNTKTKTRDGTRDGSEQGMRKGHLQVLKKRHNTRTINENRNYTGQQAGTIERLIEGQNTENGTREGIDAEGIDTDSEINGRTIYPVLK